jgi:dipeptidyl aminopeptidase/acylaminoacyl peptidase
MGQLIVLLAFSDATELSWVRGRHWFPCQGGRGSTLSKHLQIGSDLWHKEVPMKRYACFLAFVLTSCPLLLADELPIQNFFRDYDYSEARLSPDGTCVAVLAPCGFHSGLAVVDLEKNTAHWAYTNSHVALFEWANTNRLIFREVRLFSSPLLAVNKDGSKCATLTRANSPDADLLATLHDSPDEVLVDSFVHSVRQSDTLLLFPNVEKMNLFTGDLTMVVKNPGKVVRWLADHTGLIRVGIEKEEKEFRILYRADARSAWTKIGEFKFNERGFIPEAFDADNRTLYVRAEGDGDTEAIYSFDLSANKLKDLAFRHAEVDVGKLIFGGSKHQVVGVNYHTDRPEWIWFSQDYSRMQASLDHTLTNTINQVVNTSRDGSRALVLAYSDRTPGIYYLFDIAGSKLRKLFDVADWIHPSEMAEMKPIEYKSRDGLTIHGYLTLPLKSTGKNLPMVVNPHGGPLTRDVWEFDPAVQFLANRGYAVLQMNFRGSTGYGKTFREAGYKQWGLKQQDDITDGVKWAIAQGIADPKRIAIYGASYGGFAALAGLEKTPELYRCGISLCGVTDVMRTMDRSRPTLTMFKMMVAETVGDLKQDKKQLKENSPIENVDKIQVPVFLANGELDPKVPIATGRALAKSLQKRGKLFDFMVKSIEGHGYVLPGDRIDFWTKAEECLKANMN